MNSTSISRLDVTTYNVPTPAPESDGTLTWNATCAVVVQVGASDVTGTGWTYSSPAAAAVIAHHLRDIVLGQRPDDIAAIWAAMHRACRNYGARGLVMQALSAVDIAVWDLKARLGGRSLSDLLGRARAAVPVYGSGGFTNLDHDQLGEHIDQWRAAGCTAMKIKIGQSWGADTARDLSRVDDLRHLAGDGVALMVDANGAYTPAQARRIGHELDDLGITWFEEPVSSDDTDSLGLLRHTLRCDVAAGEYTSDTYDAQRLAAVVDCLQLDVTRCGGYTGWLAAAAVAAAHNLQVSAHCAPALHLPVAAAIAHLRHIEYFIDHVRLDATLFDGVPTATDGHLHVDSSVSGHGMAVSERASDYRLG
ncbi:enolase C-terminal domain-like protein [Mycolicibacterium fortuitum]|uniref:enolase C-terminal domain-like protein n=1 Tax=Mycolicibacterium fortuitum TaxID=1766 RepID=UPI0007EBEF4C|nr:enolase C-terminal domain-like protein [Mycolicibacterium fortuitum]MDG5772685.1 enolase C-terminal domain-like protein [Mycolicibacterium fortuitum]MDG5783734.1 enolase C-terminal domain-like protein [Mycolicibacterium fortuitum]OBG55700.1 mandelate racemase [Mycolicibacterium fortuitum]